MYVPFYVDLFMWFFDAPTIYSILLYFLAYIFKSGRRGRDRSEAFTTTKQTRFDCVCTCTWGILKMCNIHHASKHRLERYSIFNTFKCLNQWSRRTRTLKATFIRRFLFVLQFLCFSTFKGYPMSLFKRF
jgi:hypothetical protein